MAENKKEKASHPDIPAGIKELMAVPPAAEKSPAETSSSTPAGPAHRELSSNPVEQGSNAQSQEAKPQRPCTQKEQELGELIAKRQSVIEQLKAKNPLVSEARKQLAGLIPSIHGKGSGQVMGLVREEENLEFSIATEAYTPKKEKELLKRLREIRIELSKHKELDAARKKVDEKRNALRNLISDIRSLEHALADARKACDEKYAEVLAERKAAYSQRSARREEHAQKQFSETKRRSREEHKREYDEDMSKYLKDYDDTVSMDEIVQIERKDRKEKKEGKAKGAEGADTDSTEEAAEKKEE